MSPYAMRLRDNSVASVHMRRRFAQWGKAYLGCPGCLAASGMTLVETSLRAAMMLVTAPVLMSRVASKSWLAAVDRMARSLGRAPTLLELEISCTAHSTVPSCTRITLLSLLNELRMFVDYHPLQHCSWLCNIVLDDAIQLKTVKGAVYQVYMSGAACITAMSQCRAQMVAE